MLSVLPVPSKHMKEVTLERSPLHANNVEKPSIVPVNFEDM
jgi:hypothetical protein